MAPKTDKPRLHTITQQRLLEEIAEHHDRRTAEMARISPGNAVSAPALALAYAQSGKHAARIDGVVRALWDELYCAPYFTCEPIDEELLDPSTALGCVLLAAHARQEIDAGRPVSRKAFAPLVGVDPKHLTLLATQGRLEMEDGAITAKAARKFLASREEVPDKEKAG